MSVENASSKQSNSDASNSAELAQHNSCNTMCIEEDHSTQQQPVLAGTDEGGHETPDIVPARTAPTVRAARTAAEAASRRIQRVLRWEGCSEDSTLFQNVAQQLEAEFDAEDKRGRRSAGGGAGADSRIAINSSSQPDTFEACSSDEESYDGSYDSSFVVSDGEGETSASSSASSQSSCAESDAASAEADLASRESRAQDTRSFVITIKRQRTK